MMMSSSFFQGWRRRWSFLVESFRSGKTIFPLSGEIPVIGKVVWKKRSFHRVLTADWQSFIQHIDAHTLNELAMLSDLFESRGAHSTMNDEEIEALIGRVAELRAEIRSSELSAEMKTEPPRFSWRIFSPGTQAAITPFPMEA